MWLFGPAYLANMAPVFAMKLFPRWNARIDGGRTAKDGRPLLGVGKTWRGLAAGCVLGTATALVLSFVAPAKLSDFAGTPAPFTGPVVLGFAFGLGAIVGDAVKSYFKRRRNREGGAPWVPFDQLDFVVGGLLFSYLASLAIEPLIGDNWWVDEFGGPHWPRLAVLLVLTPVLHYVVNVIGFKLKLKKVPW